MFSGEYFHTSMKHAMCSKCGALVDIALWRLAETPAATQSREVFEDHVGWVARV